MAVAGAVVVAALAWLAALVGTHTQTHLLEVQTNAAAQVLDQAVGSIRAPLSTAVAVAAATHGDAAAITRDVASSVGTGHGTHFVSLSVWRLGPGGPSEVVSLGAPLALTARPGGLEAVVRRIPGPQTLAVTGLLAGPHPRLGYAVESRGGPVRYVAYAEGALSPSRRFSVPTSSAFHDLDIALYLGPGASGRTLLASSARLPFSGRTARAAVPFGTATLDVVASATGPLAGEALPALPWIIAGVGTALVATAVVITERVARQRRVAEELARENHRLFTEQHSIAQSLQRALLPASLPVVAGIEIAARYVPGDPNVDVGGDWYDVVRVDERSLVFAVGDVSGRGVPAASTMASLHFAIRAYAAQGDDAPTIAHKLASLLDVARDGHFATVVVGHADIPGHQMALVSAGHPPPLVVGSDGAYFVDAVPGMPIGISPDASYVPITVPVPPGASVIAYTDGLVERRGEMLDVGLERLRDSAARARHDGRPVLDTIVSELTSSGASDDVALLELRWIS